VGEEGRVLFPQDEIRFPFVFAQSMNRRTLKRLRRVRRGVEKSPAWDMLYPGWRILMSFKPGPPTLVEAFENPNMRQLQEPSVGVGTTRLAVVVSVASS